MIIRFDFYLISKFQIVLLYFTFTCMANRLDYSWFASFVLIFNIVLGFLNFIGFLELMASERFYSSSSSFYNKSSSELSICLNLCMKKAAIAKPNLRVEYSVWLLVYREKICSVVFCLDLVLENACKKFFYFYFFFDLFSVVWRRIRE